MAQRSLRMWADYHELSDTYRNLVHPPYVFNNFLIRYLRPDTLANDVDPDEIPHNSDFHLRLHCWTEKQAS